MYSVNKRGTDDLQRSLASFITNISVYSTFISVCVRVCVCVCACVCVRVCVYIYLTIIPRTRVGYELLDSGRGAKHRVGYHKLISNKREWNNCFIKYQTLDINISNYIFYRLEFSAILWKNFL